MSLPAIPRIRQLRPFHAFAAIVIAGGVFLFAGQAHAGITDFFSAASVETGILSIIGVVLQWLVYAVGSLLLLVVNNLVDIAQYTGFGQARAVNLGWAIVRDLTNMFFVLLMLVVAFGTILGVEEFSYRRMLPRLLIMAVLINFSKVIAGIFIDFSQVLMLTFVNGFAAVAGANVLNMLKINTIAALQPGEAAVSARDPNTLADYVSSYFLAIVMMGIALAVMLIMMIILVFRIVALWLLVILSPLAFFLSAFPRGRAAEAYSEWWGQFGNYLTIGPFLAFFLWLSFAVAGSGDISSEFPMPPTPPAAENQRTQQFITQAGSLQNTISYVVGIALLMGGMVLSQRFSVLGGSMIGGAASWIKDKGVKVAKAPLGIARAGLKAGWTGTKTVASAGALLAYSRTGIDLRPSKYKEAATAMLAATKGRYEKEGLRAAAAKGRFLTAPDALKQVWVQGGRKGLTAELAAQAGKGRAAEESRRAEDLRRKEKASRETEKDLRKRAGLIMDRDSFNQRIEQLGSRENELTAEISKAGITDEAKRDLERQLRGVQAEFADLADRDTKKGKEQLIFDKTEDAVEQRTVASSAADEARRAAERAAERAVYHEGGARFYREPAVSLKAQLDAEEVAKALKELPDFTMDAGDLARRFADALGRKDAGSAEGQALIQKASKQGDLDTILTKLGYGTDPKEVERFRREQLVGQFGMSDADSMKTLHGAGEVGDDPNFKALYGVNGRTGVWRQNTDDEQLGILMRKLEGKSPSEIARKLKPEQLYQQDKDGEKTLSPYGQAMLEKESVRDAIEKAMAKAQFSPKAAEAIKDLGKEIRTELGKVGDDLVTKVSTYSESSAAKEQNIERLLRNLAERQRRT